MNCPSCGHQDRDDARFCSECGIPFATGLMGTSAYAPIQTYVAQLSWSFAQIGKQLWQKAGLVYTAIRWEWVIIGLGVLLRLTRYLDNRSLWIDEAFITLNILNKSFADFLGPLDLGQAAPVGWLVLQKLVVQAFGDSEYSLRLLPFLSGVASLFLFYAVARHYIKPIALPIALGLFVISEWLVYYSSEVKQYSSDVTIALLLLLVTSYVQRKGFTPGWLSILGVTGAVCVWFSHPALFVLAGVGVGLGIPCLVRREWARAGWLSAVGFTWLVSFLAAYVIALHNIDTEFFVRTQGQWLMPFPPSSPADVWWFVTTFFGIFLEPASFALTGIAALTFLVGCFSIFSESKEKLLILLSPALFVLVASAFDKYLFGSRFLLFFVPVMLLLIGEGAGHIWNTTRHNAPVIGVTVIGLLFLLLIHQAIWFQFKPNYIREEIKPVMAYLRDHRQDGDVLYLYWAAQYAFEYYQDRYGFDKDDYVAGTAAVGDFEAYTADLEELRGNVRVWVLFSHDVWGESRFFLGRLDTVGRRLDSFYTVGAMVHLYDLGQDQSLANR